MPSRGLAFAALVVLVAASLVAADSTGKNLVFCVRASSSTPPVATPLLLDADSGAVVAVSPLAFAFPAPLVETTADPLTPAYYVVAYPSDAPGAVLYMLDAGLAVQRAWKQPQGALMFFDLQYSVQQKALFGIAVNGTYGRVLSRLLPGDDGVVRSSPLFTLPAMWYVNASAFDAATDRYFGLLNNFTEEHFPAGLHQQLVVADFAAGKAPAAVVYPLNTLGHTLRYVAFNPFNSNLVHVLSDLGVVGSFALPSGSQPVTLDFTAAVGGTFPSVGPFFLSHTINGVDPANLASLCALLPDAHMYCYDNAAWAVQTAAPGAGHFAAATAVTLK